MRAYEIGDKAGELARVNAAVERCQKQQAECEVKLKVRHSTLLVLRFYCAALMCWIAIDSVSWTTWVLISHIIHLCLMDDIGWRFSPLSILSDQGNPP